MKFHNTEQKSLGQEIITNSSEILTSQNGLPEAPIFIIFSSFWLSLVFVERIVIHKLVYLVPSKFPLFDILQKADIIFYFFISWLSLMLAMFLDARSAENSKTFFAKQKDSLFKALKDYRAYLVLLIGIFLWCFFLVIGTDETIWHALVRIAKKFASLMFPNIVSLLIAILLLTLVSKGLHLLSKILISTEPIRQVFREWNFSSTIFIAHWMFYIAIHIPIFYGKVPPNIQMGAFWGFIKDSTAYLAISIFLVNGCYRYSRCLPWVSRSGRKIALSLLIGSFVVFSATCFLLDFYYAGSSPNGAISQEYPEIWQQEIIINHIKFRDLFLILFGCILIIIWFIYRLLISETYDR